MHSLQLSDCIERKDYGGTLTCALVFNHSPVVIYYSMAIVAHLAAWLSKGLFIYPHLWLDLGTLQVLAFK